MSTIYCPMQSAIIIHSCMNIIILHVDGISHARWSGMTTYTYVHIYAQTNARQVIMCMICEAIGNRTITCELYICMAGTAAGSAYVRGDQVRVNVPTLTL